MAVNRPVPCLICYDISSPKRLQRLHRKISACAVMIQYSVYFAELNRRELACLTDEVKACINTREDDVRIYLLPQNTQLEALGIQSSSCLSLSASSVRMSELAGGRLG